MAENNESQLRSLIRLIPPAHALKDHLEKSLHMEMFAGTGDVAVKSFQGLQASVARITDDPYVATLALDVPPEAGDREKVSMALLAVGQLEAFLQGQTGLAGYGSGGGGSSINIQRGVIQLNDVAGMPGEAFSRLMEIAAEEAKER